MLWNVHHTARSWNWSGGLGEDDDNWRRSVTSTTKKERKAQRTYSGGVERSSANAGLNANYYGRCVQGGGCTTGWPRRRQRWGGCNRGKQIERLPILSAHGTQFDIGDSRFRWESFSCIVSLASCCHLRRLYPST